MDLKYMGLTAKIPVCKGLLKKIQKEVVVKKLKHSTE